MVHQSADQDAMPFVPKQSMSPQNPSLLSFPTFSRIVNLNHPSPGLFRGPIILPE